MFLKYLEALKRTTNSLLNLMLLHDTTVYSSLALGFCFTYRKPQLENESMQCYSTQSDRQQATMTLCQ